MPPPLCTALSPVHLAGSFALFWTRPRSLLVRSDFLDPSWRRGPLTLGGAVPFCRDGLSAREGGPISWSSPPWCQPRRRPQQNTDCLLDIPVLVPPHWRFWRQERVRGSSTLRLLRLLSHLLATVPQPDSSDAIFGQLLEQLSLTEDFYVPDTV